MAEYPRRYNLTGDAPGCEHTGKPSPPMREVAVSELVMFPSTSSGQDWVARWNLVWDGKSAKSRIGSYHSLPANPRPNYQTKESLA